MMYDWVNFLHIFLSSSSLSGYKRIFWCWRLLLHKRGIFEYVFSIFLLVLSLVWSSRVGIYSFFSCTTAVEYWYARCRELAQWFHLHLLTERKWLSVLTKRHMDSSIKEPQRWQCVQTVRSNPSRPYRHNPDPPDDLRILDLDNRPWRQ